MDKQSKALITFNDEPEDAISALNGAACLLKMLAGAADAGICPDNHVGMLTIRWALLSKPQRTN